MTAVIDTTGTELTPALVDLMEHEKVIEAGLHTFIDVGMALFAIKRDSKYKAAGYSSWERYLEERWDMARHYGNRLIVAASTAAQIAAVVPMGTTLPTTERQVRPLAALPEPDRAAAWADAVEAAHGGQPTAAEVQAAVDARRAPVNDGLTDDAARLLAMVADDDEPDDDVCLECGADLNTEDHLQFCSDAGFQANENWEAAQASHQDVDDEDPATLSSASGGGDSDDVEAVAAPPPPQPSKKAPPQKTHPATYSNAILDAVAPWVAGMELVVDPFAGTGRIHELRDRGVEWTIGIELEAEWAGLHPDTICGDARRLLDHVEAGTVDGIVVSPTYANRMADTYTDESVRQTYTACLGRPLTDGNSGAMQWGDDYRALHRAVWSVCREALGLGGLFILNCKNHVRDGEIQRVTEWHVQELIVEHGLDLVAWDIVPTRGLMAGENHEQRVGFESVVVLRKAGV